MADAFNLPGVWQPFGAFSMVALQGDGQTVHLKGQVALDAEGRLVGKGDMAAQVEKTLENVRAVLAAVGGSLNDVIALTHHTTDIEAFMACGALRKRFFAEPYPVTTTLEVRRLCDPEVLVEITAVAEVPRDRFRRPDASVAA